MGIAFATPILLFIAGCWHQRDEIRKDIAETDIKGGRMGLLKAFLWQLPVWLSPPQRLYPVRHRTEYG